MAARKKGREKRAAANDEGTGLVRVRLTDDQWRSRCDELASYLKKAEDVESKKAAAAEKYNGELKLLKEKISTLADEVDTHEANVDAQQAIDFDGVAGKRKRGAAAADGKAAAAGDDTDADDDVADVTEPEPVEGAA
jgi:hypothetical protein